MRTIGFPISHKENECRRAIIPDHIRFIKYPQQLYFEKNYGKVLGISDNEYKKVGCHIVSREEVLKKNIICDPKIGDAEYLNKLKINGIKIHSLFVLKGTVLEKMYLNNHSIFMTGFWIVVIAKSAKIIIKIDNLFSICLKLISFPLPNFVYIITKVEFFSTYKMTRLLK